MKKFKIIAGPCLIESKEVIFEVAEELAKINQEYEFELFLKGSFKKANRTSIDSFTGIGDELALSYIKEAGDKFGLKVLTDIHTIQDAEMAAKYADVLQIPAFLARQTDLLVAAGNTGKYINIKKAQFMSPQDMHKAAKKVASTNNQNIWLTERGTFFGYNNLVVDMRSFPIMKQSGYPVIYDATHSLQQPSITEQSGGQPEFIPALARAAVATGIDGVFFETHPDPKNAKSDSATQLSLSKAKNFIKMVLDVNNLVLNSNYNL